MNLLKSTGFLLKSLYLCPFRYPNVRDDFRIFSNLLVSSQAFTGNFGKNVVRTYVDLIIIARKNLTVKLTGYYGQYAWLSIRYC